MDESCGVVPQLSLLMAVALPLLTLSLYAAAAWMAGIAILGPRDDRALSAIVGLAALGHAWLLLALAGPRARVALVATALAGLAIGAARFERRALPSAVGMAIAAVLSAPFFVLSLYPPHQFDEVMYHLSLVRSAAERGALRFLPQLRFPLFPQFHEMLCVPAWLFAGDTATHAVTVLEFVLTGALLVEWANRRKPRAGWIAAAVWIGQPILIVLGVCGYVDTALTLFVAAGLQCVDRAIDDDSPQWELLAGFLLGTSAAVKYFGLYFVAFGALVLLVHRRARVRPLLRFGLLAAAAAGPTYLRILLATGNPLFPFMMSVFGSNPWGSINVVESMPLLQRLREWVSLPFVVTFASRRVGGLSFSALFGAGVVVALAGAWRSVRARWLALLTLSWMFVFTFLVPDARYLMPLLPPLAIGVGVAVMSIRLFARPLVSAALACAILAPVEIAAVRSIWWSGPLPANAVQRDAFLTHWLSGYQALRAAGDAVVYGCGVERLTYYGAPGFRGGMSGPWSYQAIVASAPSAAALRENLRRNGFEVMLFERSRCRWYARAARQDPAFGKAFEVIYADPEAELWRVR